jgi:hypothetical protein
MGRTIGQEGYGIQSKGDHPMMKVLSPKGLPLKIQAEWTSDSYTNQDQYGNIEEVGVDGWLIRINGKKFPRGHTDGDGTPDWTYRFTSEHTDEGKRIAINRALTEGGFNVEI